jgi:dienelactone hydrolase
MHARWIPLLALLFLATRAAAQEKRDAPKPPATAPEAPSAFDTITRKAPDGIVITADVYHAKDAARPVLVCFHMTGSSRGEYRKLAPMFVEQGYNVLAVDLRFGGEGEIGDRRTKKRSGVMNETWKMAKEKLGRDPTNSEALPDVVESMKWAHELFPRARVALIGSSYSASLVLVCAAEHPKDVDAVVALSPGEYFPDLSIAARIKGLTVPAYITCGNTDADMNQAKPVAAAIADRSRVLTFWPQDEGMQGDHGSRSLLIQDEPWHKRQWDNFAKALAPLEKDADAKPAPKSEPKKD